MVAQTAYPLTITPRAVLQNTQTIYTIGTTMTASQLQIQSTHVYLGSKYYDLTSASGKVYANITGFNEGVDITVKILNTTLTDVKFTILGQAQRVQIDGIFYDLGTRWSYITDSSGNPATQVNVNNGQNVFVSFVQNPSHFNVKKGSFAKTTAPAPATQQITGVGFKPKALILYTTAQSAEGFTDTYYLAIGVSDGATSRTVAAGSANAVSPSIAAAAGIPNVMITINSTMATAAIADLVSFNTDGFTLNWTTNDATSSIIHYIALGGGDLTNTKVGEFTENTITGNQAVTGVGFLPDFVMFMHFGTTGTVITDGYTSLGFAKSPTKEGALAVTSVGGVKTTSTFRHERTDRCIVELKPHTGALNAEASFVSMDTNGFTINWLSAPASADKVFYLALKGGQYDVGSFTEKSGTGTQPITGVGFTPKGLMLASVNNVASTAVASNNRLSFGAAHAAGAGNEGTVWSGDQDKVKPSITARSTLTTKIIRLATEAAPSSSSTVNGEADLSSFDWNGFTLNWTTNDGVARQILYVAFGDAPWDFPNDVLVSSVNSTLTQVEPHLSDGGDANGNSTLAAAITDYASPSVVSGIRQPECRVYSSSDAGATWTDRGFLGIPSNTNLSGDPVVSTDSSGTLFIACLARHITDNMPSDIVYWRSTDRGVTWGSLIVIVSNTTGIMNDKPWIASDIKDPTSAFRNNVYACWIYLGSPQNILFRKIEPSSDPNRPILTLASGTGAANALINLCSLSVGKSGIIYATWARLINATAGIVQMKRSFDGGKSFETTAQNVTTFVRLSQTVGTSCSFPWGCLKGTSTSGFRVTPLPSSAVDYNWDLHITYMSNGTSVSPPSFATRADVMYVKATGCTTTSSCTFSSPISVVNDGGLARDQWEPMISVSLKSNTIHITALDRRNDASNTQWELWAYDCNLSIFACTSPSDWAVQRVSSAKSDNLGTDFIGDYHGIASNSIARVREAFTVWTDTRNSNFDVFSNRKT